MEVKVVTPNINNFLQVRLDKKIIDYLWNLIEVSKNNKSYKNNLAGNISESLLLDDSELFFYKSVCVPLVKCYRENNKLKKGIDPVNLNAITGSKTKLLLNQFWVNYQYKTEFNPIHDHTGVYSCRVSNVFGQVTQLFLVVYNNVISEFCLVIKSL